MKGVWLVLAAGILGAIGCETTPKRQMRPPTAEEFPILPSNMYTTPPDLPRDQPLLTPKSASPGAGPAMPGPSVGGPGGGPGMSMGAPGGMRR
ncbi:MAG TPA: hypothetical protein VKD90_03815 [Gemmataceae bacterium]|nr:hypothetical protein [Gemmataceae bacterium]